MGGGYGGGYGMGGGYGGGYGDVSVADRVTNISDLFSTIDDRMVGEPPAIIGTSVTVIDRETDRAPQTNN